jgi:hypothetical protein
MKARKSTFVLRIHASQFYEFGLGGTAKSLNLARVRVHRQPVHRLLAFGVSEVHRLVHDHQISHFIMAKLLELRVRVPQNEHSYSRSHLSFFGPLPHLTRQEGYRFFKSMVPPLG